MRSSYFERRIDVEINDPAMLGGRIETQMMASTLSYGVQFLDQLSDEHQERLVQELVRDVRSVSRRGIAWDQTRLEQLTGNWFSRGRIYETLPEDALVPTADLAQSATQLFLERVPLQLAEDALAGLQQAMVARLAENPAIQSAEDAVCRLLWLWFQWGRSYQKGNPPSETPLPN